MQLLYLSLLACPLMDLEKELEQIEGSPELCNGKDDDNDGDVDENPMDAPLAFQDEDGDGWGAAALTYSGCTPPASSSPSPGDCEDGDPELSPGAPERCDGIDNNCDERVDDADPQVDPSGFQSFYADQDADGFGDPAQPRSACAISSVWVVNDADCDDLDASVSPAAMDNCDGIDNNCDGADGAGLHVAPTGSGWVAEYNTIQQAVDAATEGDELCIAPGTYTENVQFGTFNLKLRGGGSGLVVLKQAMNLPVLTIDGGQDTSTLVEGLSILDAALTGTGAQNPLIGSATSGGAAVQIVSSGATLRNVEISGSTLTGTTGQLGGAAIFAWESDLILEDVQVRQSRLESSTAGTGLYGGAVSIAARPHWRGGNEVMIDGLLIEESTAASAQGLSFGGGLSVYYATLHARGVEVRGSEAHQGGAVLLGALAAGSYLEDSTFSENVALQYGGAILVDTPNNLSLRRLDLRDNQAATHGGGISCVLPALSLNMENLVFAGNRSGWVDGAANPSCASGSEDCTGAAAWLNCTVLAEQWTVVGNVGGAISFGQSGSSISHSTFVENLGTDDIIQMLSDAPSSSYNHGYGNVPATSSLSFDLTDDPLFVSTSGNSPQWDLHLQTGSPLIDQDRSRQDPDGSPGDIGAYGGPNAW